MEIHRWMCIFRETKKTEPKRLENKNMNILLVGFKGWGCTLVMLNVKEMEIKLKQTDD